MIDDELRLEMNEEFESLRARAIQLDLYDVLVMTVPMLFIGGILALFFS